MSQETPPAIYFLVGNNILYALIITTMEKNKENKCQLIPNEKRKSIWKNQ